MRESKLRKIIQEELKQILLSKEFEQIIGNIVFKAVSQKFIKKIKIESGKENPGGPPVVLEKEIDILEHIGEYLPYVEGAIRGCQQASEQSRNRSFEVVKILEHIADGKASRLLQHKQVPRITNQSE